MQCTCRIGLLWLIACILVLCFAFCSFALAVFYNAYWWIAAVVMVICTFSISWVIGNGHPLHVQQPHLGFNLCHETTTPDKKELMSLFVMQ